MLCQHCQKNEATNMFAVNWMGTHYLFQVCNDCLENMKQYASRMGFKDNPQGPDSWLPGKEMPHTLTDLVTSEDNQLRRRRQLTSLRFKLHEATNREDYEDAAQLRDNIAALEQEECYHES